MSLKIKKISIFFPFFLAVNLCLAPLLFASSGMADYLCELGVKFYKAGRMEEAMIEFRKVLLVDPGNKAAKIYIDKMLGKEPQAKPSAKKASKPAKAKKQPPPAAVKQTPAARKPVLPAPKEKKEVVLTAVPETIPVAVSNLKRVIAEAKRNIEIIDQKIQRQQPKPPPAPKPSKEELRKAASEKRAREEAKKRGLAMEKHLEQALANQPN